MLKITGVIFCVAGCCGYGLVKISSWNRALQEMNQWIVLLEKMKSHICYQRDGRKIYGIGGEKLQEPKGKNILRGMERGNE